jgi:hypothetical protein
MSRSSIDPILVVSGKVFETTSKRQTNRWRDIQIFRHKWKPAEEKRGDVLESKRETHSANCRLKK